MLSHSSFGIRHCLRVHARTGLVALILVLVGACEEFDAYLANLELERTGRTTGPYVQMDDVDDVVIAWFTPQPHIGEVAIIDMADPAAPPRILTEDRAREHHEIRVADLAPRHEYAYRLQGPAATDTDLHRLPPIKAAGERVRFALLGDTGSGEEAQRTVAAQIEIVDPDFIFLAGDVVYPIGADAAYDKALFEPYAALMDHIPIFPCLGNHDVGYNDGAAYLRNFILPRNGPSRLTPERVYSIDLGDVHLVSIDRTRNALVLDTLVIPWVRADLAASDATWKFVLFHQTVHTTGTPSRPVRQRVVDRWGTLFDEAGVDLSLAGHNHYYERTLPLFDSQIVAPGEGTVYIVSGNGGKSLSTFAAPAPFSAARNNDTYGFVLIEVEGRHIEITHIDEFGDVLDYTAWDKPAE